MRAALAAEVAGIPAVSIVCEGFEGQAAATARGHGVDDARLAITVGHVDTQSVAELERNIVDHLLDQVLAGLLTDAPSSMRPAYDGRRSGADAAADQGSRVPEPAALDIVVSGGLDEVQQRFLEAGWTDGLPIVPPTIDRVEALLEPLGHDPWKVLGTAPTTGRDVTVWSVGVNAVMAGCTAEHVPVLLAVTEVLLDPAYGVEHSGNTTGADALIIVSGPSAASFGLHGGAGALRDGVHANTAIGRWLRLVLRNLFGFTPDEHDKATFGNTFRVVLTEDHDTITALGDGWPSFAEDAVAHAGTGEMSGDRRDDRDPDRASGEDADTVTVVRMNSGAIIGSVFGSTPEEIVPVLADGLARVAGWDLTHVHGLGHDQFRPLLVLSPLLARTFASAGWSKDDVRRALFASARIPARRFERLIGEWSNLTPGRRTLADLAGAGAVPPVFAESDDPERLVPIVTRPERFELVVAGDPHRANAYAFANDGPHGWWTTARVDTALATDLVCALPPR